MASSPTALLALHGLRLKGFTETAGVCALYGLDEADVTLALNEALKAEFVVRRDGRRAGWSLNVAGRTENERLLASELDESGHREAFTVGYKDFLSLNSEMLATCTRWQVKDPEGQVLNDHSDAEYDAAVMESLEKLDAAVQPIISDLAERLDRFSIYAPRFNHALEQLAAGELEWFTRPIMESYHTVWFELHEDLLATLGIDRASEQSH